MPKMTATNKPALGPLGLERTEAAHGSFAFTRTENTIGLLREDVSLGLAGRRNIGDSRSLSFLGLLPSPFVESDICL